MAVPPLRSLSGGGFRMRWKPRLRAFWVALMPAARARWRWCSWKKTASSGLVWCKPFIFHKTASKRASIRGNKVDFWESVCAEISFHSWCIHSFVHTFRIWSAVHTPVIYVNTGGARRPLFLTCSFVFRFLFLFYYCPPAPEGEHRSATPAGLLSFVRGGHTCRGFTSSVAFATISVSF